MPLYRIEERALIADTTIKLLKAIHTGRKEHERALETLLISGCILVGQNAGKPRTVSAIVRELGTPRATVLRKLDSLMSRGIIIRTGRTYTLTQLRPGGDDYIDAAKKIIIDAAKRFQK